MTLTPAKRFIVRTALVTGTTLAAVLGAQSLAMLDRVPLAQGIAIIQPADPALLQDFTGQTPLTMIQSGVTASAPSIVILRHPGQQTAAPQVSSASPSITTQPQMVAIQPPNPVQVLPLQPVIQVPQVPQTRSSR